MPSSSQPIRTSIIRYWLPGIQDAKLPYQPNHRMLLPNQKSIISINLLILFMQVDLCFFFVTFSISFLLFSFLFFDGLLFHSFSSFSFHFFSANRNYIIFVELYHYNNGNLATKINWNMFWTNSFENIEIFFKHAIRKERERAREIPKKHNWTQCIIENSSFSIFQSVLSVYDRLRMHYVLEYSGNDKVDMAAIIGDQFPFAASTVPQNVVKRQSVLQLRASVCALCG